MILNCGETHFHSLHMVEEGCLAKLRPSFRYQKHIYDRHKNPRNFTFWILSTGILDVNVQGVDFFTHSSILELKKLRKHKIHLDTFFFSFYSIRPDYFFSRSRSNEK